MECRLLPNCGLRPAFRPMLPSFGWTPFLCHTFLHRRVLGTPFLCHTFLHRRVLGTLFWCHHFASQRVFGHLVYTVARFLFALFWSASPRSLFVPSGTFSVGGCGEGRPKSTIKERLGSASGPPHPSRTTATARTQYSWPSARPQQDRNQHLRSGWLLPRMRAFLMGQWGA